jgi:hypothetical protein
MLIPKQVLNEPCVTRDWKEILRAVFNVEQSIYSTVFRLV